MDRIELRREELERLLPHLDNVLDLARTEAFELDCLSLELVAAFRDRVRQTVLSTGEES